MIRNPCNDAQVVIGNQGQEAPMTTRRWGRPGRGAPLARLIVVAHQPRGPDVTDEMSEARGVVA
jgi:hypothetical protein